GEHRGPAGRGHGRGHGRAVLPLLMITSRAGIIALAVFPVLWIAHDSGWMSREPAPEGTSVALGMLAAVFGVGAWVMQAGGQARRVPLMVGRALGTGAYALLRATGL